MLYAIKRTLDWIIFFFGNFNPSTNFLSDIAAFEAVVIGIAIPLSFNMVSRISERYQSEVIAKQFFREIEVKILPYLLMVNICIVISLRFLFPNEAKLIYQKVLIWISVGAFLVVAVILLKFVNKLRRYIIDIEFVLGKLKNDAEKIFK